MPRIPLEKADREAMARTLRAHLKDEYELELGGMDAEFLLDFITERFGPHFYNQGLLDAQASVLARMELVAEAIDDLRRAPPKV